MKNNDLIFNIVWDEFIQAKTWEQYLSEYTGYKMDWKKYINITSLVIAGIAGISWDKIDNYYFTTFAFAFVVGSHVFSAITKDIVISAEDLQSLTRLRIMYIEYSVKLERLIVDSCTECLEHESMRDQYFELRCSTSPIESLKDSLNIDIKEKVFRKAISNVDSYQRDRFPFPRNDGSGGG